MLPSENEPWGLAINEAMCAGLPIVLSEEIGCAEDLVATGVNGATFRAGDVDGLAAALRPLLVDPAHRARAGKASLERLEVELPRVCRGPATGRRGPARGQAALMMFERER